MVPSTSVHGGSDATCTAEVILKGFLRIAQLLAKPAFDALRDPAPKGVKGTLDALAGGHGSP